MPKTLYGAFAKRISVSTATTVCQSYAHPWGKQIGSKRSISQAVIEVFSDADAGKGATRSAISRSVCMLTCLELSRNLKMGVSYIARSEMLKRDPEKLQTLIVACEQRRHPLRNKAGHCCADNGSLAKIGNLDWLVAQSQDRAGTGHHGAKVD